MSTHRSFICPAILAVALASSLASAESPNLGTPVDPRDLAGWDISVLPDGAGLPAGSGTPAQGERIYAEKCVACHGEDGKGAAGLPLSPLFGGGKITDISAGMKTIANFWPYATTLFDFIRRGMPWTQPRSLTDDEVYALTAFILAKNKLIGDTDMMNAETLPKVRMPNRNGFIVRFPDKI
jgi:S-disulfanyl-L-cysteine oxidoreductase SoxD